MSVLDKVKFLVYRVHEKGLEVFLLNSTDESGKLSTPELTLNDGDNDQDIIELDPIKGKDGKVVKAVAIEGDWHDLPSIRKLFFKDVDTLKSKIKSYLPILEKGSYVGVKDVGGKVMPDDNTFIKELKEIVIEKNSTQNI